MGRRCWVVAVSIGVGVDVEAGRVGGRAYATSRSALSNGIGSDSANIVSLIAWLHGEHQAEPIAPAFAHLFGIVEAKTVARSTRDTDGYSVSVLMGDDAVVKVPIGSYEGSRRIHQGGIYGSVGQFGFDEVSIGLANHHRRDADVESIAAHVDRIARHIVNDDRSYGSSILRCLNLGHKGAAAPVDECDLSAERTAVGERVTTVVDGSCIVDGKYHICR